jgi:hypothetical protein
VQVYGGRFVLIGTCSLNAQMFRGGIAASVEDQSGAVPGGTIVKALNPATGQTYQTLTSSTGDFAFKDLISRRSA